MRNKTLRALAESAVLVALAFVLSFFELKLWQNGGSVGIVMVPLVIIAIRWGVIAGTGAGLAFGLIKCLLGGGLEWGLVSIILDYVIAYGLVGFGAGFFSKKKNGVLYGIVVGATLRFIPHFISGITAFKLTYDQDLFGRTFNQDTFIQYSIYYNGSYLIACCAASFVILFILNKQMSVHLKRQNLK